MPFFFLFCPKVTCMSFHFYKQSWLHGSGHMGFQIKIKINKSVFFFNVEFVSVLCFNVLALNHMYLSV